MGSTPSTFEVIGQQEGELIANAELESRGTFLLVTASSAILYHFEKEITSDLGALWVIRSTVTLPSSPGLLPTHLTHFL